MGGYVVDSIVTIFCTYNDVGCGGKGSLKRILQPTELLQSGVYEVDWILGSRGYVWFDDVHFVMNSLFQVPSGRRGMGS